jgi:RNA polymerase sigma factor (sigma-70 family)
MSARLLLLSKELHGSWGGMMKAEDDLRRQCQAGARQWLQKYEWRLVLCDDAFLDAVHVEVVLRLSLTRGPSLAQVIRAATINQYALVWYEALKATRPVRRSRAYEELHRYLLRDALYLTRADQSVAADCVQEALVAIYVFMDENELREPSAFPAWARRVLRHKVMRQMKKGARLVDDPESEQPGWQPIEITASDLVDEATGVDADEMLTRLAEGNSDAPPEIGANLRALLEAAVRNCVPNLLQQEAFIQCYLHNKLHSVVAAELGVTVERLSVLKHRAIKKLKKCAAFLALLEDLL